MSKLRVYQLARELNLDNSEIIRELQHMGVPVTSHSNTVEDRLADRLRRELGVYAPEAGRKVAAGDDDIVAVEVEDVEVPAAPPEPAPVQVEPPPVEVKAEPKVEPKVEEKAPVPEAKIAPPVAPPAPPPAPPPPAPPPKIEQPAAARPAPPPPPPPPPPPHFTPSSGRHE